MHTTRVAISQGPARIAQLDTASGKRLSPAPSCTRMQVYSTHTHTHVQTRTHTRTHAHINYPPPRHHHRQHYVGHLTVSTSRSRPADHIDHIPYELGTAAASHTCQATHASRDPSLQRSAKAEWLDDARFQTGCSAMQAVPALEDMPEASHQRGCPSSARIGDTTAR